MTPAPTAARLPRAFVRVLALAGLSLAFAAAGAPAAAAQMGEMQGMFASMPELANYRLTAPALEKFVAATNALKALEDEDIDLDEHLEIDDPAELSIDQIASAFDSEPRIRQAITGAGMSTREYVTFMMSMLQTIMGSVMVQMGGEEALEDMPAGVLKDNIRFFLDNQEAFESLDS
jgi:hypothetical protein